MDKQLEALVHKIIDQLRKINHVLSVLLRQPRQQDVPSISNTSDADRESDGLIYGTSGLRNSGPSPTKPNNTQKKWYQSLKGWERVLQTTGIIFAIGYAVITFLQWRDLRHNFQVDERAWLDV